MSGWLSLRRPTAALSLALALLALPAALGAQRAPAPRPRADSVALLRRRVVQLEDRVARMEQELASLRAALEAQQTAQLNAQLRAAAPRLQRLDDAEGWRRRESWRQLRRGLNDIQVRYLLGEPGQVVVEEFQSVWYYPDRRGGVVRFDRDNGQLLAWSEPNG